MAPPGFTADLSLGTKGDCHLADRNTIGSERGDGNVTMQSCSVDTLAVCSLWLQPCFYAVCAIPRAFGSGACTTCMTGCLYATNPVMATVCVDCVNAGPCTTSTPLSGILGCPYNLCA